MGDLFDIRHQLSGEALAAGTGGDDDIFNNHKRPALPDQILAEDAHQRAQQFPVHIGA
ncbi:hypothetical protein D3C80_2098720 [compost metagenome]